MNDYRPRLKCILCLILLLKSPDTGTFNTAEDGLDIVFTSGKFGRYVGYTEAKTCNK